MAFGSKVSGENAVDFEKALRMLRGLEAFHSTLSLPGRLMRVLSPVVKVSALPMSYSRQHDFLSGPMAAQFVGNDHTGCLAGGAQQLAEKANSGKTVALRLHQNVDNGTLLVDCAPEIMLHAVDL